MRSGYQGLNRFVRPQAKGFVYHPLNNTLPDLDRDRDWDNKEDYDYDGYHHGGRNDPYAYGRLLY